MTAYRQQALGIAATLRDGTARPRDLKPVFPDAAKILQGNVYGWFEKIDRGTYRLTDGGRAALVTWVDHLPAGTGDQRPEAVADHLPVATVNSAVQNSKQVIA
jgi:hypothetical protein